MDKRNNFLTYIHNNCQYLSLENKYAFSGIAYTLCKSNVTRMKSMGTKIDCNGFTDSELEILYRFIFTRICGGTPEEKALKNNT